MSTSEERGTRFRTKFPSRREFPGILRLVVQKILNHVETGVTSVYDRHSYDAEKKDALEKWAKRLTRIVSNLKVASGK